MRREWKVYWRFIRMHLLSGLEYKGWWMMLFQVLLVVFSDCVSTLLLFSRFGSIGEWTLPRILLVYSLALIAFGLAESFCRGFDYFPWKMLRTGGFDRLMLRPLSLTTQVAASFFHLHRLMRVACGLFLVGWSLHGLGVPLTPENAALLALSLLGGTAMYCGVFIMSSGIAFFTIKALDWIYIFTNASYQATRIPMPYLPRALKGMFTFLVPMLVVSYYPASAVCGWGDAPVLGLLSLPAGLLFLGASLLVWRLGVRRYKSTGS